MAEDITNLDITENYTTGPDPKGPKPFNRQNLFDLLKDPTKKSVAIPVGKNLKEFSTPDELWNHLGNETAANELWSYKASDIQKNFGINSSQDLNKKQQGYLTDVDKIAVGNIQKTPVMPKFGEPGFDVAFKDNQAYMQTQQQSDESAIDAFSKFAGNGLNVTADGKVISNYQEMRDYFSNPDNIEKWQTNFDINKKVKSIPNFDLVSEIQNLNPKETLTSNLGAKEIVSETRDKQFFGNLSEDEIGKMLDDQQIDFTNMDSTSLELGEAGNMSYLQEFQGSNQRIYDQDRSNNGINFEEVTEKVNNLNKDSFREYYRSKGYGETTIDEVELEFRTKARKNKYRNIDLKLNEGSQDYDVTKEGDFAELAKSLGTKTQYQSKMNRQGYDLLSDLDKEIANDLTKLDKLKREIDAFGKTVPENSAWFMTAKGNDYIKKKQEYDSLMNSLQERKKRSGLSGENIYDPETRTNIPVQEAAQLVKTVVEKKPKEYYTKSLLGNLIRDRNTLFLDVEDLRKSIDNSSFEQRQTPEYTQTKKLYLSKSAELIAVNKAIYTNDSAFHRKDTGFMAGFGDVVLTDSRENDPSSPLGLKILSSEISRSALANAWYNYAQNNGVYLDPKDLESIEEELTPKFWEGMGQGTAGTLLIAAETIVYSAMANEMGAAATASKGFTKLKEFAKIKYGSQTGEFLVGWLEKGIKLGTKAGPQLLAGQSTTSYVSEEVAENSFESIASRFSPVMRNKYTMFLSKLLLGTVGGSIGEVFGNLADAEMEEGRDIRQLFKDVYGETWETQQRQLAYTLMQSVGFAGAGNFNILLQSKQVITKMKAEMGGKFTDPLLARTEIMIDEAIESNKSSNVPKKQAASAKQTKPVEANKNQELAVQQNEKAQVEKRIADVNEEFHVVEDDGAVNKEVSYRYNKQTGKLESKGYTEFNQDFEETNEVLDEAVKRKQTENGLISADKVDKIARKELGIEEDAIISYKDGKILYQRDPAKIAKDNRQRVASVKQARKNTFDAPIAQRRAKIKENQFADIKDVDKVNTPEFGTFFNTVKDYFGTMIRMNYGSMMYNGAKIVDSASRGLAKVSDYMAPMMQKFTQDAKGKEVFDTFVNYVLDSKAFKESPVGNVQDATEYAKTVALNLLLNEKAIVKEFLGDNDSAMTAFDALNEKFIRHVSKNHTGKAEMRFNSSFYSTAIDENSKKLTDADLDATDKQWGVVKEERRKIDSVLQRSGEEQELPVIEAIRYKRAQNNKGTEFKAEDFLKGIGEDIENKTPEEITQLADQKAAELYDMDKYENYLSVLQSFQANRKNVVKRINKELKTTFDFTNYKTKVTEGSPLDGSQPITEQTKRNKLLNSFQVRAQRKAAAQIMYRMLETMAIRSNTTPDDILNDVITFEKVQKENIDKFMADNADADILFDAIVGLEGAKRIPEIMHNYQQAQLELNSGIDPKAVYAKWGWFADPTGKMKYAMTPLGMTMKLPAFEGIKSTIPGTFMDAFQDKSEGKYLVSDLIDYPELFKMYPDLQNIGLLFVSSEEAKAKGGFEPQAVGPYDITEVTEGNLFSSGKIPGAIYLNIELLDNPEKLITTLKHEIQHAVQFLENAQNGYNTELAKDLTITPEGLNNVVSDLKEQFNSDVKLTESLDKVKNIIDDLSSLGGELNTNYNGSVFLFGSVLQKLKATAEVNNLSDTQKQIEIEKILNSVLGKITENTNLEDSSITAVAKKIVSFSKGDQRAFDILENNVSTKAIYFNTYGEYEAREASRTVNAVQLYNEVLNTLDAKNYTNGNKELVEAKKKNIEGILEEGNQFFKNAKRILAYLINNEDIPSDVKTDLQKSLDDLNKNKNLSIGEVALVPYNVFANSDDYGVENQGLIDELMTGQFLLHQRLIGEIGDLHALTNSKLAIGSQSADAKLLQDKQGNMYKKGTGTLYEYNPNTKKLAEEFAKKYDEVLKSNTLFQQNEGMARAAVVFKDTQAIIYALTDPTVASPLHEMAHVYEGYLTDTERQNVLAASGETEWNTAASEYFARGFEKFLADGVAPSKALTALFNKFKIWMTSIYSEITGSPIDVALNPKMREIYSTMLGDTTMREELSDTGTEPLSFSEKDMIESFVNQMKSQGKTDEEIYRGLIEENGFTPSDVSEFFSLKAKQTVQAELEQTGTFKEEAASISDEIKYNTVRNSRELIMEMDRLNVDEAKGILYAFQQLPNIDVAVAKVITDILAKKAEGKSVLEDFGMLAETGTNLGRALQRFKMLKAEQASYTLSAMVMDLNSKGRQIPAKTLRALDEQAKKVDKLTKEYENAKRQAEKFDFLYNESPLRPGMSNLDYFELTQENLKNAKSEFGNNLKPWARLSSVTDLWSTLIRGDLLTTKSLITNITASVVKTGVQGAANTVSTLISYARGQFKKQRQKQVTFKGFDYYRKGLGSIVKLDIDIAKGKFSAKTGPALKQAGQYLRYGHSTDASSRFEIERGFNGFKALAETIGAGFAKLGGASQEEIANRYKFALNEKGEIKNKDIVLRALEGTLGLPAETMFRLLGAPDAVFKNTAYFSGLYQEARRLGYKDKKQIDWFIAMHSDYSNDKAYTDALKFIYANNSTAYRNISGFLYGGFKEDNLTNKIAKLGVTTLVPYQKIPINVAAEYFDFMVPLVGVGRAGYKYAQIAGLTAKRDSTKSQVKKDEINNQIGLLHQEAEEHLGRSVVGVGLIWTATSIIAAGAVSGSAREKKERDKKQIINQPNSLNVTLLLEQLGVTPPTNRTNQIGWTNGDSVVSLAWLGVFGGILGTMANSYESEQNSQKGIPTAGEIEEKKDINTISELYNFGSAFSYLVDQSFVKNIGNVFSVAQNAGDDEERNKQFNKLISDLVMTLGSPLLPNVLTSFSKVNQNFQPDFASENDTWYGSVALKIKQRNPFADWTDDQAKLDVFGNKLPITPEGRSKWVYNLLDVSNLRTDKGVRMTFADLVSGKYTPSFESMVGLSLQMGAPNKIIPQPAPVKIKDIFGQFYYKLDGDNRQLYQQTYYKNQRELVTSAIASLGNDKIAQLLDPNSDINMKGTRENVRLGHAILSDIMAGLYATSAKITRSQLMMGIIPKIEAKMQKEDPEQYNLLQKAKSNTIFREGYQKLKDSEGIRLMGEEMMNQISKEIDDAIENGTYDDGSLEKILGDIEVTETK